MVHQLSDKTFIDSLMRNEREKPSDYSLRFKVSLSNSLEKFPKTFEKWIEVVPE